MSFTSLIFFSFLPLVFSIYWVSSRKAWQNSVLVAASYLFYGWWDWRFCFLLLASSLIDYAAGLGLSTEISPRKKRMILAAALSGNILILGFFKYFNFFVDSLAISLAALGIDIPTLTITILLPVGISFYTFQTMSYTLDVYWGRMQPQRNFLDYLAFVSFFPQLVAGPIERARNLLPQFQVAREFSFESAKFGLQLILWGLAKKMVLADNLAPIVENAYRSPGNTSAALLVTGTVAFAFQIYWDFSAYSDIALGTARLFGLRLMRNFAYPYFSQSITEFWRRWHISLSSWFRDYVYIPAGGNQGTQFNQYRNLMTVALLSGLWHGAAWHFIVWGGLHGFYLVAERIWGGNRNALRASDVPGGDSNIPHLAALGRMLWTFSLVCVGWVFFRAASVEDAFQICGIVIAGIFHSSFYLDCLVLFQSHALLVVAVSVFVALEWFGRRDLNPLAIDRAFLVVRWTVYTAFFWTILIFGTSQTAEFIYFQF